MGRSRRPGGRKKLTKDGQRLSQPVATFYPESAMNFGDEIRLSFILNVSR